MRLRRVDKEIYKKVIHILPTIVVAYNSMEYMCKNVIVEFHFLVFHARLVFLEVENDKTTV